MGGSQSNGVEATDNVRNERISGEFRDEDFEGVDRIIRSELQIATMEPSNRDENKVTYRVHIVLNNINYSHPKYTRCVIIYLLYINYDYYQYIFRTISYTKLLYCYFGGFLSSYPGTLDRMKGMTFFTYNHMVLMSLRSRSRV